MSRIAAVKLRSGHSMPMLGLGTWQLTGKRCRDSIKTALDAGYTHIDTAEIYGNHREVGEAIKGHERSELFIATKVWRSDLAYGSVLKACNRALREMETEYLDLYLIHWPNGRFPIKETLKACRKLVDDGKVKSTGLSNFYGANLSEALKASDVPVSVNQVEFHAHLYQKQLLDFCRRHGVLLTAYSPLARGAVLDDPVITEIAERHGKAPAQVSLRWLVQHGLAVIPKSTNPSHLRANMDIFSWQLTAKEMEAIDSIKTWNRLINPSFIDLPLLRKVPKPIFRMIPQGVRKRLASNGNFFK